MFEPERRCLYAAGEFGSRSGLARSAGHRSRESRERRSDRGVLLFAYFRVLYRDVRMSRERRMRGAADKQEKVRRPRFGNRKYSLLMFNESRVRAIQPLLSLATVKFTMAAATIRRA